MPQDFDITIFIHAEHIAAAVDTNNSLIRVALTPACADEIPPGRTPAGGVKSASVLPGQCRGKALATRPRLGVAHSVMHRRQLFQEFAVPEGAYLCKPELDQILERLFAVKHAARLPLDDVDGDRSLPHHRQRDGLGDDDIRPPPMDTIATRLAGTSMGLNTSP